MFHLSRPESLTCAPALRYLQEFHVRRVIFLYPPTLLPFFLDDPLCAIPVFARPPSFYLPRTPASPPLLFLPFFLIFFLCRFPWFDCYPTCCNATLLQFLVALKVSKFFFSTFFSGSAPYRVFQDLSAGVPPCFFLVFPSRSCPAVFFPEPGFFPPPTPQFFPFYPAGPRPTSGMTRAFFSVFLPCRSFGAHVVPSPWLPLILWEGQVTRDTWSSVLSRVSLYL